MLSPSLRGDKVSSSQLGGSENSSPGRVGGDCHFFPVCDGEAQCCGRCSLSPIPCDRVRMDSPSGGLRLPAEEMAEDGGSFCYLSKSLLTSLFCANVGPNGCSDGHHAAILGPSSGIRLSPGGNGSSGPEEDPGLSRSGGHLDRSIPDLLSLLVDPPVPFLMRWHLLRQPHVRKFHQSLLSLHLHAWRLSSDLLELPGSLLEWLDSLATLVESRP